jgi:predicted permease
MPTDMTVLGGDGAERVPGVFASATLFDVLGLRTSLGRGLSADDDLPAGEWGAGGVAVLSYRFWTSRFNRDPAILGKTLNVSGRLLEIIGVLAPGEELPQSNVDVWLPFNLNPANRPVNAHFLQAIGRLEDGVSIDAAQRELVQLTTRFPELFPSAYSTAFMEQYHFAPAVLSLREHVIGGAAKGLWILLAAVGLVLLIAGANVANLFLARLEGRRRELAIRTALGAERAHLAWHYLTESLLLTLLAGVCALALAYGGIHLLLGIAPSSIPRLSEVHLSWSSIAFAAVVSLVTGVIFGAIPMRRRDVDVGTLRENSRGLTAARGQHVARGILVVGQVALALMLLVAAGLLLQSFRHLRNVKPGFEPIGVLAVDISIPASRYGTYEAASAFYHDLQTRIAALPGVMSVGATQRLPLANWGGCATVYRQDKPLTEREEPPCIPNPHVSPGYFQTMRIHVRGEIPTWSDVENHVSGVVVSRALAERLWPGEDPIGKGVNNGGLPPFYRVVGVADDVRAADLQKPPVEAVYYPTIPITGGRLWSPVRSMSVVVRTRIANPLDLAPTIRRIVTEMDREVPIADMRTMEQVVAKSMARVSFNMLLLGIAAGMALILSAVGIYGVISYVVGQRRGEIGIRVALGARTTQVGGLVVLQSVRLAAAGVVLGLVGAIATTHALRSLLFAVSPTDPLTLGVVATILIAIAALASYIPARRAARVDPIEALRAQ